MIQTWSDYWRIHPLVVADYCRLPVKPVVLAEGAYEARPEYPTRPIAPCITREAGMFPNSGKRRFARSLTGNDATLLLEAATGP